MTAMGSLFACHRMAWVDDSLCVCVCVCVCCCCATGVRVVRLTKHLKCDVASPSPRNASASADHLDRLWADYIMFALDWGWCVIIVLFPVDTCSSHVPKSRE